jgi:N utilization substance protein A
MNAEFIAMLEHLERERGIKRDVLIEAVETALVSAAKKAVEAGRDLRCVIDRKTGDIKAFAKMIVADRVTNKHDEISLTRHGASNPTLYPEKRSKSKSLPRIWGASRRRRPNRLSCNASGQPSATSSWTNTATARAKL